MVPRQGLAAAFAERLVAAYLVLYTLPFPFTLVPVAGTALVTPYGEFWNAAVPWVGARAFGLTITVRPNGSGDTTYNYVQVFCFAVVSLVLAGIWTLIDRRRGRGGVGGLFDWLRLDIRLWLATTMITYGAVKVIQSQFPAPTLGRLLEPFGEASPMGLLWTFMGASRGYNVFTGLGELVGGVLLVSRRTTLLGALICLGVMSHVAALNFCYDVPVKLFSLHLLLAALFLAGPDLARLADLFLLNRAVAPAAIRPLFRNVWLHRTGLVVRTGYLVAFLVMALVGAQASRYLYGDLAPRSPLYGIWEVVEFRFDGMDRPPLTTDPVRWRRVVFDSAGMITIQPMSDSLNRYLLKLDDAKKTLTLSRRTDPKATSSLAYSRPEPDVLALDGTFEGRKVVARLRRVDPKSFLLLGRGFHWINEYPFNR
jgi:hypothetical protein